MFVLLGLAGYVLFADDIGFGSSGQAAAPQKPQPKPDTPTPRPVEVAKTEPEETGGAFSSTRSSAASGLSNFYKNFRNDIIGDKSKISDNVIRLKPNVYTLDEQLQRREAMVQPGPPEFTGEVTVRHFRKGETIRNQLHDAAKDEGMALIWQLERDYIIKEYFQVNADFLKTLSSVAHALNSDFENHVYALYCFNQRAVVITYDYTKYVKKNCKDASRKDEKLPG